MFKHKQIADLNTDHIRSRPSIPCRIGPRRRLGARARVERVSDGGSLRGGPRPGSQCCDWSPTCRLQRTQRLLEPRLPRPCSTTGSIRFYLLPHQFFQIIQITLFIIIKSPSNSKIYLKFVCYFCMFFFFFRKAAMSKNNFKKSK